MKKNIKTLYEIFVFKKNYISLLKFKTFLLLKILSHFEKLLVQIKRFRYKYKKL